MTPGDRRALVEHVASVQAEATPALARLQAAHKQAQARVAALERQLADARRVRDDAQRAALTASMTHDLRLARLQHQLRATAPAAVATLRADVAAVADAARALTATRLGEPVEDITGERVTPVATNRREVAAVLAAASELDRALEAEQHAAEPDETTFGPLVEARLAVRVVRVPARLAELYEAAIGVPALAQQMSPAEQRARAWRAEESLERRYPEPSTSAWRPWR